jgi:hypothetical protein
MKRSPPLKNGTPAKNAGSNRLERQYEMFGVVWAAK